MKQEEIKKTIRGIKTEFSKLGERLDDVEKICNALKKADVESNLMERLCDVIDDEIRDIQSSFKTLEEKINVIEEKCKKL